MLFPSLKIEAFSCFLFDSLLELPGMLMQSKRLHWQTWMGKDRTRYHCAQIAEDLGKRSHGALFSWIQVDGIPLSDAQRELIKSLGNDIMFIDGELGAALEHSISIEPVDSEQLHSHSPSSSFFFFLFFRCFCFHPPKMSKLKAWKPGEQHSSDRAQWQL